MKKIILPLILSVLINNAIHSQSNSGIVVGMNTTIIKNTDVYEYKPGVGMELGYLWNIGLSNHFDILLGTTVKGISAHVKGRGD